MEINWQNILDQLTEFAATWGIRVIGVLVALFIGWKIAGWIQRLIVNGMSKRIDESVVKFFGSLARYGIIAGVVIGCLGVFGIETTSFAAVIAAMGLAIGLAFQGTLSNFSAGVMLLIFRPFKVGDVIEGGGKIGVVLQIDLFSTELTTPQNLRVIVPNSNIFSNVITNYTHNPTRRVDVPVGVDYGADIDETRKVLEAALPDIPFQAEGTTPQVFLDSLGDSSVNWQMRVFAKPTEYWDAYQATIRAAKMALDKAGISIPFPQQDVHLDPKVIEALNKSKS
jgi:small conductance mechanosensitive channel